MSGFWTGELFLERVGFASALAEEQETVDWEPWVIAEDGLNAIESPGGCFAARA